MAVWVAACASGTALSPYDDDAAEPVGAGGEVPTETAGGAGGSSASAGAGGNPASAGAGGEATTAGSTGAGGSPTTSGGLNTSSGAGGNNGTLNGCTKANAILIPPNLGPIINWNASLGTRCYKGTAPLKVLFQGDFNSYPLEGGQAPVTDPTNPVTIHNNGNVSFKTAGTYGFFCGTQPTTMRGAFFID